MGDNVITMLTELFTRMVPLQQTKIEERRRQGTDV